MHILAINDDGPPNRQSSPYIQSFVLALQAAGHTVSVILPHEQRSWISKAHFVGQITKPMYFRPGTPHQDNGITHPKPAGTDEDVEEWVLINGTPASCAQLGLFHFFKSRGPIDLVISGPNYGRNATSLFNLSSGTIGGAMEAAVCGKKAVALSFAFESRDHDPKVIAAASKHAIQVIEHLVKNWSEDVDLYNINVPLIEDIAKKKVLYTNILQNHWTMGSSFEEIDAVDEESLDSERREREIRQGRVPVDERKETKHVSHQHRNFKWAPKFADVKKSVAESDPGNDGWAILQGYTSVTPLKANFMHSSKIELGELKLNTTNVQDFSAAQSPRFHATIDYQDAYVQPIILSTFQRRFRAIPHRTHNPSFTCPPVGEPWLQICPYETLDFEAILANPSSTLANSYIIRKALIRKHYLAHTVSAWLSKYPDSVLKDHVKPTIDFEIDYAEFLDDALLEAYELKESLEHNERKTLEQRQWWILKPGMSDRGQGIRLFSTMEELQSVFDEWDSGDTEDDGESDAAGDAIKSSSSTNVMTSQLRHFVAQPYISRPLLLPSFQNRKFHIRVYVLAIGALQVYVYDRMLALCASKTYATPGSKPDIDLEEHLTNTCLQPNIRESGNSAAVHVVGSDFLNESMSFRSGDDSCLSLSVFEQIKIITSAVFEAAARGQMVHFQTLPNAFEVFGVDFLIDAERKAWLLEINAFPDFAQSGAEEGREVVEGFWDDVIRIAVGDWVDGLLRGGSTTEDEALKYMVRDQEQIKEGSTAKGSLRKVLDIDQGRR